MGHQLNEEKSGGEIRVGVLSVLYVYPAEPGFGMANLYRTVPGCWYGARPSFSDRFLHSTEAGNGILYSTSERAAASVFYASDSLPVYSVPELSVEESPPFRLSHITVTRALAAPPQEPVHSGAKHHG